MLIGKLHPCTPHTCLYLVNDEQDVLLIAEGPQGTHKTVCSWDHTALALNRLEHNGHSIFINQRAYRVDIIKAGLVKAIDLRGKDAIPARLARGRHSSQCAPMKTMLKGNDLMRPTLV